MYVFFSHSKPVEGLCSFEMRESWGNREIELFNNVVIDVIIKRCFFVLFTHHFSDIPSKSSINVDVFSFSNACVSWMRICIILFLNKFNNKTFAGSVMGDNFQLPN